MEKAYQNQDKPASPISIAVSTILSTSALVILKLFCSRALLKIAKHIICVQYGCPADRLKIALIASSSYSSTFWAGFVINSLVLSLSNNPISILGTSSNIFRILSVLAKCSPMDITINNLLFLVVISDNLRKIFFVNSMADDSKS